MFKYTILLFLILGCSEIVKAGTLPSSIKPCHRNDPQLNKCVSTESKKYFKTFLKGVPDLGIPKMDPLRVKDFNSNMDDKLPVSFNFTKIQMWGLNKAELLDVQFDLAKKTAVIQLKFDPHATVTFKVRGEILTTEIRGDGKLDFVGTRLKLKLLLTWEVNNDHIKIVDCKSNHTISTVKITFSNLKDKASEATLNLALNNIGMEIFKSQNSSSMTALRYVLVDILNKMFSKLKFSEMFI